MDERSEPGGTAGWHPDPTGRYEFRWFNGTQWTADVSVDGHRYVDHGPLVAPVAGHAVAPAGAPLPRGIAVVSFVFGLVSLVIAWVPFVVFVAVAGAIAAVVVGIAAVRRVRAGVGTGRGLAVAGIVTGAAALCLSPVGFILTRVVYDEVVAYLEPGRYGADITACTRDGSVVTIEGTLDNLDDETHDYVVNVDIGDSQQRRDTAYVHVDGVAAGEHRQWKDTTIVSDLGTGDPRCEIDDVTGPYPFGLPPSGRAQLVEVDATQAAYIRA